MALYNLRNPAVKRLMREAEELSSPTEEYHAQPLEDNLFEWHFTLRGPPNTDYDGGIYHGRITLPPDYPMKPPSIILLTPNGRFEINKKICLSISGHHPESWQPSWSIRTALLAIIGFMPTHGNGALGSLDYTPEERKQLALQSQDFKCQECGLVKAIFAKMDALSIKDETETLSSLPVNEVNLCQIRFTSSTPIECTIPSLPELDIPNLGHSNPVTEENTPNLHLRKVEKNPRVMTVEKDATEEPSLAPSKSHLIHTIFMWLIISAITFLCIRRLFSL